MLSKALIKHLRSLQLKKFRDSEQLFVVEGPKMLLELVKSSSWHIEHIYASNEEMVPSGVAANLFSMISDKELVQISGLSTPNGVLAVAHYQPAEAVKVDLKQGFHLLLDKIQDPGNFGTIIRLADWFGVDAIICSEDSADFYNPKVIQASMGSIFRVPVLYADLKEVLALNRKQGNLPVFAAMLTGESVYETSINKHAFLVMGNESKGVSDALNEFITNKVHIPSAKKGTDAAESLNVSIATAILCSERARKNK